MMFCSIITGGLNVYPKEIELLIDDHEDVVDSAVIGVPHKDFGESVLVIVVLKDGAQANEAAILTATAANLARFKQPKQVILWTSCRATLWARFKKDASKNL